MTLIQHVIGTLPRTMGMAALIDEINAQVPRIEPQRFDVTRLGAAGDGLEDDTPAIQSAIDTCFAAGGGTVYLPGGRYKLSRQGASIYNPTDNPGGVSACGGYALHVPSGVQLLGAGYSTVLLNGGMLPGVSQLDNSTWYSAVECVDGVHDIVIRGVRFKGENGNNASGGTGFQNGLVYNNRQMDCVGVRGIRSHDIVIRDCWFEDQYGFTVHCEGNADRVHVLDSRHRYCANGLNSNAHKSIQARNVLDHAEGIETDGRYLILADNSVEFPTESGISIGGETTVGERIDGVVVSGCVVSDGLRHGVLATDALDGFAISKCTITRVAKIGVALASDGFNGLARGKIDGCIIKDAGLATNAASDRVGVFIGSGLDIDITNTTVEYGFTAGYDTAYGLLIGTGGAGTRIGSGNRFHGSVRSIGCSSTGVMLTDDNTLDTAAIDLFGVGAFQSYPRRVGVKQVPAGSGSAQTITIDPRDANIFRINATGAGQITVAIANASGQTGAYGHDANQSQIIEVVVFNSTGGAIPDIIFQGGGNFRFRTAGNLAAPATLKAKGLRAYYDAPAQQWMELSRSPADV